jgi:excisionase family DNA binding protein
MLPATDRDLGDGRTTVPGDSDRPDSLMDIEDVARRLKVRVRYVRRLVAERRIPYVKFGHLLRFEPADIDDWIARARIEDGLRPPEQRRRRGA